MKDLPPFTVVVNAKNMLFKLAVIGALFLAMLIPICIYQLANDRFAQTLASTKHCLCYAVVGTQRSVPLSSRSIFQRLKCSTEFLIFL